jgi:hypothetical protein
MKENSLQPKLTRSLLNQKDHLQNEKQRVTRTYSTNPNLQELELPSFRINFRI